MKKGKRHVEAKNPQKYVYYLPTITNTSLLFSLSFCFRKQHHMTQKTFWSVRVSDVPSSSLLAFEAEVRNDERDNLDAVRTLLKNN